MISGLASIISNTSFLQSLCALLSSIKIATFVKPEAVLNVDTINTYKIEVKNVASPTVSGIKDKTYTGKSIAQTITVKDGNKTLKAGTDYKVTYKNNKKAGKATVTIAGIGNYKFSVTKTFKLNPKGTSLSKLTAKSKGFEAKWKKQTAETSGYQIEYATSSNFKGSKTVLVSSNKTTKKTISKLKKKKKYYVRIRTYKTVSGEKYYSSWSKVKTVTTKK